MSQLSPQSQSSQSQLSQCQSHSVYSQRVLLCLPLIKTISLTSFCFILFNTSYNIGTSVLYNDNSYKLFFNPFERVSNNSCAIIFFTKSHFAFICSSDNSVLSIGQMPAQCQYAKQFEHSSRFL